MNVVKQYYYHGSLQDLSKAMQTLENPNIENLANGEYRLCAEVTVATNGAGISVFLSVSTEKPDRQKFTIRTKTRKEHYVILAVFVVLFLTSIFSSTPGWAALVVVMVWVLSHVLFYLLVRSQELPIISRFKGQLGLQEIAPGV